MLPYPSGPDKRWGFPFNKFVQRPGAQLLQAKHVSAGCTLARLTASASLVMHPR